MIPFWKKILSWLYPLNIETVNSTVSGELEINLQYGNIVLDTKNANYSFGNLHLIFQEAIFNLQLATEKEYKVLILGFGAGSIANILINENNLKCHITGIELDETINELSKKYFQTNIYNHCNVIITDAYTYMVNNSTQYDLVFVDIFIDTTIPAQFQSKVFLLNIQKALSHKGKLLMNSMSHSDELFTNWQDVFGEVNTISIQENKVLVHEL